MDASEGGAAEVGGTSGAGAESEDGPNAEGGGGAPAPRRSRLRRGNAGADTTVSESSVLALAVAPPAGATLGTAGTVGDGGAEEPAPGAEDARNAL